MTSLISAMRVRISGVIWSVAIRSKFAPIYTQFNRNTRYLTVNAPSCCFLIHTLWNRPDREIRPLILWGLGGGFFEAF